MAVNEFADLTEEEFKDTFLGGYKRLPQSGAPQEEKVSLNRKRQVGQLEGFSPRRSVGTIMIIVMMIIIVAMMFIRPGKLPLFVSTAEEMKFGWLVILK